MVDAKTIEERAYDQARKEFYKLRLENDVEREVLREEAQHLGQWLPPTENEKAFKYEDEAFEDWKKQALQDVEKDVAQAAGDINSLKEDILEEIVVESSEELPPGDA